ncbi:TPA: hypothetical protein F3P23_00540 [Aeromonas hydrophila]|nr:hypothetical protein [Aeromonas hydrophila]
MADTQSGPDIEPQEPTTDSPQVDTKKASARRSFSKLRRELNDEELTSPAIQKMLIDEIERLEEERVTLNSFRDKFHTSDKEASVLKEQFKSKKALDIFHTGNITVGAAILGYTPSIWASQQPSALIFTILGCVLIVVGLIAKAVKP